MLAVVQSSLIFVFLQLFGVLAYAQYGCVAVKDHGQENSTHQGSFIAHQEQQQVIQYPHLREADIMWMRRVWRVIDLRQKLNQPLYFPIEPTEVRSSLFSTILCALNDGTLTAFSTGVLGNDDMFTTALSYSDLQGILRDTISISIYDDIDERYTTVQVEKLVENRQVKQYLIKEEWFFDNQRSVMDVRIIGICPIKEEFTEEGDFKGYKRLFWIYFPELRYVLRRSVMFNSINDAGPLSYEDVFMKRLFNSYVVKASNVHDRFISEYKVGIDAIIEGEKEEERIFNLEQDLWHY